MEKKRDWLALILEIVCWLAMLFGAFFFFLSYLPLQYQWVFPVLAVLTALFEAARRKLLEHKAVLRIVGLLLTVLTLSVGFFCFQYGAEAARNFWWTEDISHYERVRGSATTFEQSKKYFFPLTIPDYAEDVKFHYNPQILQGGEIFSLEFTASPERLREWEAYFKEEADYPGSYLDQGFDSRQMAKWVRPYTDCRVYVIYARTQWDGDNPSLEHFQAWNHGYICYGAVDPDAARVYFYESNW